MRYIKVKGGTSFCGTNFEEYLKTDMTNEQLDAYCADASLENAELYNYIVFGWDQTVESYAEENEISVEEAEQEMEDYYAEAWAGWEEISEEEYEENI